MDIMLEIYLRNIIFISIILLVASCEQKTTEIRYYPAENNFSEENAKIIGLDSTSLNFREITNKAAHYYNKSEYLIVEFNDGTIKKLLIPFVYDGGLIKSRNKLRIKSDSILIDGGYSITELKRILKRHYRNNSEDFRYSDSPRKAFVEVTVDTNTNGKQLKDVLLNLSRTFDEIKAEINDTIELRVYFDYMRQIPAASTNDSSYLK